ncbi:hypothetical protein H920_08828 [Fukomys damarensis]|uniref:Uncharacterized protein n=1 Tax=Fukomys damarensis TaxID=885580 RepID=A0A091DGQ9_FUKDA|nr:hypothetical protein H920_08828 [Fukomys damarensis]
MELSERSTSLGRKEERSRAGRGKAQGRKERTRSTACGYSGGLQRTTGDEFVATALTPGKGRGVGDLGQQLALLCDHVAVAIERPGHGKQERHRRTCLEISITPPKVISDDFINYIEGPNNPVPLDP